MASSRLAHGIPRRDRGFSDFENYTLPGRQPVAFQRVLPLAGADPEPEPVLPIPHRGPVSGGRTRLDRVLSRAHWQPFVAEALRLAHALLVPGERVTGEAIRERLEGRGIVAPSASSWGAAVRAIRTAGLIEETGAWVAVARPCAHARRVPVYAVLVRAADSSGDSTT
jgi:hypothetical protein